MHNGQSFNLLLFLSGIVQISSSVIFDGQLTFISFTQLTLRLQILYLAFGSSIQISILLNISGRGYFMCLFVCAWPFYGGCRSSGVSKTSMGCPWKYRGVIWDVHEQWGYLDVQGCQVGLSRGISEQQIISLVPAVYCCYCFYSQCSIVVYS